MAHPLSRTEVRLGLAAVAMVGVIGAGAVMLGGSETGRALGRGLAIAVVPPVEHEVLPGETMEVGALNDGFDRAGLERIAERPLDDTLPPPAWIGDESLGDATPRMPMPTPVSDRGVVEVAAPPADPLADGSRAFGFDNPARTTPASARYAGTSWKSSPRKVLHRLQPMTTLNRFSIRQNKPRRLQPCNAVGDLIHLSSL